MNVIVVGLGSMGRRRIRLIKKYSEQLNIIGIDSKEERRKQTEDTYGITTYSDLEAVLTAQKIDCGFVCTSPLSHNKLINLCLAHDVHVFTELNLVSDGYDTNVKLAAAKDKVLFLSSTFLYRAEVQKIDELVKQQGTCLNYTYHVGQYLPDWHPWESYKDFFVNDKRSNGCRELFAIELPWIIHVFGEIKDFVVKKSKMSTLNIDYDDNYMVIIEHESGHKGMLTVDVVSRKAVRNLEIYGEHLYLSWDGSPTGLMKRDLESKSEMTIQLYDEIDQLDNYSSFVVENAYYNEVESFFHEVLLQKKSKYSFIADKEVLDIIDQIETC